MSSFYLTAAQIEAIERSARRARAAEVQRMLRCGGSLLFEWVTRLHEWVRVEPRPR